MVVNLRQSWRFRGWRFAIAHIPVVRFVVNLSYRHRRRSISSGQSHYALLSGKRRTRPMIAASFYCRRRSSCSLQICHLNYCSQRVAGRRLMRRSAWWEFHRTRNLSSRTTCKPTPAAVAQRPLAAMRPWRPS